MKQKRFESEAAIIAAIDECHERYNRMMFEADEKKKEIEGDLNRIFTIETTTWWTSGKVERDSRAEANALRAFLPAKRLKQKKLEKSASNLIEKKAKRLGAALSAFRTQPMECVLHGDQSVILI